MKRDRITPMKPIAILCFSCFVFLVPAHADIMVQAENGSQNSVDFQVLTQATVSLSFEILGAPTSARPGTRGRLILLVAAEEEVKRPVRTDDAKSACFLADRARTRSCPSI